MWHWDQGHLPYFQFDALRQIAAFVIKEDFKTATRSILFQNTGLDFAGPPTHSPSRQYARTLKLSLLISEQNGNAIPTPVAKILAQPGMVTCDEYLHFFVRAFTEPSPALSDWRPNANFRYPLLFSLKYLLIKTAIKQPPVATFNEIIGAYKSSGFSGGENQEKFISLMARIDSYEDIGKNADLHRQSSESIRVISQISYLHTRGRHIIASLNPEDAAAIFSDLTTIAGHRALDRESEIGRIASYFKEGSTEDFFDYPNTTIDEVIESGFKEGSKVKKTHVIIERNSSLRKEFFVARPITVCDVCSLDTIQTYPWTERVLDIHHLMPLSSGTRVEAKGTTFDDLIPICPSCHRAVHRYYDKWLKDNRSKDFRNRDEARTVYQNMKDQFPGLICA